MLRVSTYIIGIIVFTVFIFGGVAMISEFMQEDSSFIDDTTFTRFNNTFNRYNSLQAGVSNLKSGVDGSADSDFGTFGVLNGLINTAWNTITTIFTSFSFMDDAFGGLTEFLGVPAWVVSLVISLVVVILVFAIIGAIFQREI